MAIWEGYDGELELWLPVRLPNGGIVREQAAEQTLGRSQASHDDSKTTLLSASDATMNAVGSSKK